MGNITQVYSSGFTDAILAGGAGMGMIGLFIGMFFCLGLMSFGWLSKSLAVMMGAAIAWMGLGAYGFATSASTWDIYYVMGALSMALILVCLFVGKTQRDTREEEKATKLKVVVEPTKSYRERFEEYEKRTGAKTKSEREAEAEDRLNRKLRRRLE